MKLVFNIIVLGLPASFWYTAICKEHENENVSIFQMCLHGFFLNRVGSFHRNFESNKKLNGAKKYRR